MLRMNPEEVCRDLIICDAVEIRTVNGKLYCIIGFNKSTKDNKKGYWEKKGKRVDFDYLEQKVIASGRDAQELIESIRLYRKLEETTGEEAVCTD